MLRKVSNSSTRFWYYHHPVSVNSYLVKTGVLLAELALSRSVLGTYVIIFLILCKGSRRLICASGPNSVQ